MKTFTTIALLIASVVVAIAGPAYRVRRIEIIQPEEGATSNLGRVQGFRSCGGPGEVLELRVEGCNPDSPCQVPHDGTPRASELDFVPSEDIPELGVRVNVLSDGQYKTVYEKPVANSAVQSGERYTVNAKGAASKDLKGHTVTLQYVLYRVGDNTIETCTEADFEVV